MPDEIDAEDPPPPNDDDAPPLSLIRGEGGDGDSPLCIKNLGKSFGDIARILRDTVVRERLLGPGDLETNEMTRGVELGRVPVDETMQLKFRERAWLFLRGQRGDGDQKRDYRLEFAAEPVRDAFRVVGSERIYHPVREYVQALPTSPGAISSVAAALGQKGIGAVLLRKWAISCVARAYQPGCQVDTVLILVSEKQGQGKSTFFRSICGDRWFSDSPMDVGNKDSLMQLGDSWIYEWGELSSMRRPDWEAIKGFTTSRIDAFRPPYGTVVQRFPRTAVIVGTTNRTDFLSDPSGNRRWWPIKVGSINQDQIRRLRDHFWSEARDAYLNGESWWIDEDTADARKLDVLHSAVEFHDEWESELSSWLDERGPREVVTVSSALRSLGVKTEDQDKPHQMRCAAVLAHLGWDRGPKITHEGKRVRPWTPKTRPTFDFEQGGAESGA